jgi:DNA-binding NarL/FixJ family response regulator
MTDASSQTIRVVLADDSEFVLRAVARLLRSEPRVALVATAGKFAEAVRLVGEHKPDVVVLDLHMAPDAKQDPSGLKAEKAGLRLLAITAASVNDPRALALANSMGADKLLDKMKLDEELIPAILEFASK